jgi:cell fate regulator YaaT (PSP1 superfamily)
MSCSGGSCSCGKKEGNVAEESKHLVQMPAGGVKLPVFDWSKGLDHLALEVELVEVRFKNNRKAFYRNVGGLELAKDDRILVESSEGHDLGTVSLSGKAARKKYSPEAKDDSLLNKVIRKASVNDLKKWLDAKKGEYSCLQEARKIALLEGRGLSIKDVEFRADGKKVTIFYTAEEYMEKLAQRFEESLLVKVEMKRIGSLDTIKEAQSAFN